ncbi:Foie gras liver health family 1 [Trinorchestia longiramus]|nr:Foie gras liver health family 1 [Trinorchestia longiramus]
MSRRPIVSYAGDSSLFCGLQGSLVAALPEESVEWRRSFGRSSKLVNIEVDFVPYSEECLVKEPGCSILQLPVLYTYWTDCTDIEIYKNNVREKVQKWVVELRQRNINDWMVVVVGAPDARKPNKLLPRTTVLDKMKADFGGKQAERCVSLYEPVKTDSRSMESWQALLAKMRSLVMVAYNRALNKFEESMRAERERRTEKSWSFCEYFSIQEELAEVMLMMGVQDEALVQYDELDALLTQFVLNSAAGDTPLWLSNFREPAERWEGLNLRPESGKTLQEKIHLGEVSLLQLRNYLFQQQAGLLFTLNKPWEVASRALNFLQNTANELQILGISLAAGGVACWGFLSCLEVIHSLARCGSAVSAVHPHTRHIAPLWAYARDKLQELGKLCGLHPASDGDEKLHTVVALVCGMGDDPHADNDGASAHHHHHTSQSEHVMEDKAKDTKLESAAPAGGDGGVSFSVVMLEQNSMSPMTRLKEALSSKEAFRKHYLELSEVAISTCKHIGHVRCARLIGRDLASFYLSLGQPQQAANFLGDLLNSFTDGCWPLLAADTRAKLLTCYSSMADWPRLLRVGVELACCSEVPLEQRSAAFESMQRAVRELQEGGESVCLATQDVVRVEELCITSPPPLTVGSTLNAKATLRSSLPLPLIFSSVDVLLKLHVTEDSSSSGVGGRKRSGDTSRVERRVSGASGGVHKHQQHSSAGAVIRSNSAGSESSDRRSGGIPEEGPSEGPSERLHMSIALDYKQDNSLASAAVICANTHAALSRRDSHSRLSCAAEATTLTRDKNDVILTAKDVTVPPGSSTLTLTAQVLQRGTLSCKGAVLHSSCLELVQQSPPCIEGGAGGVEVLQMAPRLALGRKGRELLAGLPQHMILTVHAGTTPLLKDTAVELRSSRGLLLSPTVWHVTEDERHPVRTSAILDSSDSEKKSNLQLNADSNSTDVSENSMVRELQIFLPEAAMLSTVTLEMTVLALLGPQRDTNAVDHIVSLSSPVLQQARQDVDVHFSPPFCSVSKLHTANIKKFFQVKVTGLIGENIELKEPSLSLQQPSSPHSPLLLKGLNVPDQVLTVSSDQWCSYMWELGVDYSTPAAPPLKLEFSVQYSAPDTEPCTARTYRCTFDLCDYKTLFTIKSRVEPSKGSEFCRAGSMCHLLIAIEATPLPTEDSAAAAAAALPGAPGTNESSGLSTPSRKVCSSEGTAYDSIMYEVLADQTMWAVCGRTSGVLSVECARRRQNVTLDVMPLLGGFLPLPSVRLSKYIPADVKRPDAIVGTASSIPKLEPFAPGQVYNFSKGTQVHVLTAVTASGTHDLSLP